MRGNQAIINSLVYEHPDNPLKDKFSEKEQMNMIYYITNAYWQEWRRQLTNSPCPRISAPGLGKFTLMHGRTQNYLRKIIRKIRYLRFKYADTYLIEGSFAHGYHQHLLRRFRSTWVQLNDYKKYVNARRQRMKDQMFAKHGENSKYAK